MLYDLLKKNKTRKEIRDQSHSLSHPPGFTPLCSQVRMDNDQINRVTDGELAKEASPVISAKVMNMSQHVQEEDLSLGNKTKKEWVKELTFKNKLNFIGIQETKMGCVSHMDVKFIWGNSNYDFVCSNSLGNSG
nr:RNA-directed DNA polymerase, eukaryota, reverse transcriptase zinc-binding domain protein [Tanacetum cinerariifolium]